MQGGVSYKGTSASWFPSVGPLARLARLAYYRSSVPGFAPGMERCSCQTFSNIILVKYSLLPCFIQGSLNRNCRKENEGRRMLFSSRDGKTIMSLFPMKDYLPSIWKWV